MKTGRDNEEFNKLFGHDNQPRQRLGQGQHGNVFYYGESIDGNVIITSDGRFFRKYIDTQIDEKGKAVKITIDDIKKDFGLNCGNDFDYSAIDTHWQRTDMGKWLDKKTHNVKLSELIKTIEELNCKHVWHVDNKLHKLMAYFAVYSYCFTLFEFAPRLNIFAMTASGKSTQTKLLKYILFNPLWISKGTPASLIRSVESTCGVPLIDNFDKIGDEEKQALFHFIETSFDKEGVYRLAEAQGRNWKSATFFDFCPLVINSTMPFGDVAVENRTILLRMEKTGRKMPKLDTRLPLLREIRHKCRVFVLENWQKIQEAADSISREEINLTDRTLDIWLGILALCKLNSEQEYKDMITLAASMDEEKKDFSDAENLQRTVCDLLLQLIGQSSSIEIDIAKFADMVYLADTEFSELKKEKLLSGDDLNASDAKEREAMHKKHRLYLKMVKNFLRACPNIWQAKNIKNHHNKQRLTVDKSALDEMMKTRNYAKTENELTQTNITNNPNNPNNPNIDKPNNTANDDNAMLVHVSNVSNVSSCESGAISKKFPLSDFYRDVWEQSQTTDTLVIDDIAKMHMKTDSAAPNPETARKEAEAEIKNWCSKKGNGPHAKDMKNGTVKILPNFREFVGVVE